MNNFDLVLVPLIVVTMPYVLAARTNAMATQQRCAPFLWLRALEPNVTCGSYVSWFPHRSLWHPPCPWELRPTGTRERDRLIIRLPCTGYAYVHNYPFSSPSVPRPMDGRYIRVAYSVAGMYSTRNLCCTRRISLATRNYKLIRNQHVSPSMTDETASSPLVLAKSYRIQVYCAKKKYADWEYRIREDLNELSYCLAQNPLSWSLVDHHNGLPRWRITA